MPRKKAEKCRNANGNGTIRKKTVIKNDREYTYWESRYTEGYDPGTDKQIQRSITGKTQKEVAQKLKAATAAIDAGTYTAPQQNDRGAMARHLARQLIEDIKAPTKHLYMRTVSLYILPALGAVKLEALPRSWYKTFTTAC